MTTTLVSISTPSTTVHFSDIDSDAAAAILHRTARRRPSTGNRDTRPAVPGTRRFRRHLNSLLSGEDSGSEYYSGSDGEGVGGRRADEVEEEVWRSEWRGEFVAVGGEFFEGAEKVERRDRADDGGNRVQRRLRRLERERQERRQQRRERLDRRQRRLAAVEVMGGEEVQTTPPFTDALVPLSSTRPARTTSPSVAAVELKAEEEEAGDDADDADDAMQIEALILSDDGFVRDLWLLLDKHTRAVLKRLTDYSVLHHLEQLLLAFKAHVHSQQRQQQLPNYSLSAFIAPSSSSSPHYRVLPSMMADEVALLMPEPFLRFLTYALLAFHFMHSPPSRQGGKAHEDGVVIVRMQRGWVRHTCSLVTYCTSHFNQGQ